jgi:PP-loop superfamily ATP-utilizing enzyme
MVRSPLIEVGMNKAEVRELSHLANVPTWDKPASRVSSRIAYGTLTIERLAKVDRGEEILEFGFRVRVRHHDSLVRLEIAAAEMDRVLTEVYLKACASFPRAWLQICDARSTRVSLWFYERNVTRQTDSIYYKISFSNSLFCESSFSALWRYPMAVWHHYVDDIREIKEQNPFES